MKIYVIHSTKYDFRKNLYEPIRNSGLDSDYDIILPHEFSDGEFDSKSVIPTCDLVIAELSHPSFGQGIELGWANASEVPILILYHKEHPLKRPMDVITKDMMMYKDSADMIKTLEAFLIHFYLT